MSSELDCRRAEQLLSDHLEQTLAEPLRLDLEAHLAACEACRHLRLALEETVSLLRAVPVPAAPADLEEKAASRALATSRGKLSVRRRWAWLRRPRDWRLAAAAVLVACGVLVAAGSLSGRSVQHYGDRLVTLSARWTERKDRFLENLRLLKIVVGTAFSGRVAGVSERMDDYRRLLERSHVPVADQPQSDTPDTPNDGQGQRPSPSPEKKRRTDEGSSS